MKLRLTRTDCTNSREGIYTLNIADMKYLKIVFLLLFTGSFITVFGQKDTLLHKEVEVTKAYQPVIKEAHKISIVPNVQDNVTAKPDFSYSIQNRPERLTNTPTVITAAKLTDETTEKSDVGYVKAGVGNYLSTFAELFLNQPQSDKSTFSLYLKHYSSGENVRLYNGFEADIPYSQNQVAFSSKYLFRNSTLSFDVGYDRMRFNYYGMPNIANLVYADFDRKQVYQKAWMVASFGNVPAKEDDWSYKFNLNYNYFTTRSGQTENYFSLSNDLSSSLQWFKMNLHTGFDYLNTDSVYVSPNISGRRQSFLVHIDPSLLFEGDQGKAILGIKTVSRFDHNQNARLYLLPYVRVDWDIFQKYLNIYGGLDGNYNPNVLSTLIQYCPFRNNLGIISPTVEHYRLFGGFQGQIKGGFSYSAEISYASIHGAPSSFLSVSSSVLNPEQLTVDNRFMQDWINTKQSRFMGEMGYSVKDLSLKFRTNIYSYSVRPMGSADYDFQLSANYKFTERLTFDASFYTQGKASYQVVKSLTGLVLTTALIPADQIDIYQTNPVIDLGAGARYQFTPKISFWARGNNLFFHKQDPWLGYCEQGMNLLAGASYSF